MHVEQMDIDNLPIWQAVVVYDAGEENGIHCGRAVPFGPLGTLMESLVSAKAEAKAHPGIVAFTAKRAA